MAATGDFSWPPPGSFSRPLTLLAAFGARRPTRDIDLQATRMSSDVDSVRAMVADVLDIPVVDGVDFNTANICTSIIREEGDYSGVRVAVDARLASAGIRVKIDVNVGGPIWPEPEEIEIPRLLADGAVRLCGYPLHMVHAEKIVTGSPVGRRTPDGGTLPMSISSAAARHRRFAHARSCERRS